MLWSREEPGGVSRSQPAGPAADEGNLSRVVLPNSSRNSGGSRLLTAVQTLQRSYGGKMEQIRINFAVSWQRFLMWVFFFLSPLSLLPSLSIKLYFCGHMHTI